MTYYQPVLICDYLRSNGEPVIRRIYKSKIFDTKKRAKLHGEQFIGEFFASNMKVCDVDTKELTVDTDV